MAFAYGLMDPRMTEWAMTVRIASVRAFILLASIVSAIAVQADD